MEQSSMFLQTDLWNVLTLFYQTGDLYHTYSGHFEEVTGLLLVGTSVVSVGIDATIRQWSLRPTDIQRAREETQNTKIEREEEPKESVLTEEEERELAELMADDD
jgi:hypothetical protein